MSNNGLPSGVKLVPRPESGEFGVLAPDGSFITVGKNGSLAERVLYQLAAALATAPAAAPDDGRAIIEAALAKAQKADPSQAPFPLSPAEAAIWHQATASAYQHALEMMEPAPRAIGVPGIDLDALNLQGVIHRTLMEYRCQYQQDEGDGGGYPLVDALTPKGHHTIAAGIEEIETLIDAIVGELSIAMRAASHPQQNGTEAAIALAESEELGGPRP